MPPAGLPPFKNIKGLLEGLPILIDKGTHGVASKNGKPLPPRSFEPFFRASTWQPFLQIVLSEHLDCQSI